MLALRFSMVSLSSSAAGLCARVPAASVALLATCTPGGRAARQLPCQPRILSQQCLHKSKHI